MLAHVRMIGRAVRTLATVDSVRRVQRAYEVSDPEVLFAGRRTRYVNIGYWSEGIDDTDDAGDALAEKLADVAGFQPTHSVLDVGFGYGDQDLTWLETGRVRTVTGVDILPRHVRGATERAERLGIADRAQFREGSATDLPFPDATFDRVVSMDAAYHFRTRHDFFREAMRVLRPGGRLATVDLLPLDGTTSRNFEFDGFKLFYGVTVPQENWYDRGVYADVLAATGFVDIDVVSVRDRTLEGWYRMGIRKADDPVVRATMPPKLADAHAKMWRKRHSIRRGVDVIDYITAVATKPG